MLDYILSNLKKFREQIYTSIQYRADAFMDLIDSLCSNTSASSPVQLSLNAHHRRSYNSITDVVTEFHQGDHSQNDDVLQSLIQQAVINNLDRNYYLFATDCTPSPRVNAKTLEDRSIIYSPNAINSNKPISIGHKYSITGFLPPKDEKSSPWILPLITERVSTADDEALIGAQQLQCSLEHIKAFDPDKLCVNVVDNGYCKPEYIYKLHNKYVGNDNLVTIVRARSNRVFWRKSEIKRTVYSGKKGHELWYGSKFNFKDPSSWHKPEQTFEKTFVNKKGKQRLLKIQSWSDMLMRQTRGIPMNEHPFTIYRITLTDEQGKNKFHKPMWLMAFGKQRNALQLEQVYTDYMQRYNIEHFFRFSKNNLLADKFQTPELQHEENWWSICSLAYAMLFVARAAATKMPYPWERYLPEITNSDRLASPTQVQRSFQKITIKIGTPALAPKPRGKPLGRAVGSIQHKRKHHEVIIKSKNYDLGAAA